MFELKQGRIELPNAVISMEPIPGLPRASCHCLVFPGLSLVWCLVSLSEKQTRSQGPLS